jgi:predicted 2-oxoglutarate/Fe(II)-dependent dioxygenase YbiX
LGPIEGTPSPLFRAPSHVNPDFIFGSLGGRYILLAFLPGPGPQRDAALQLVAAHQDQIANHERIFFGVIPDEVSFAQASPEPPLRWFLDRDGDIRKLFGLVDADGAFAPHWVVIDPSLRILSSAPLEHGADLVAKFFALPSPAEHAGVPLTAPVLIVPRIIEPWLCRKMIDIYREAGGEPSGVMRQHGGQTMGVLDNAFKRRRDVTIEDANVQRDIVSRLQLRLLPEIVKAFGFTSTRIERYIVACYDADEGGYFRPHRDNDTTATAHRKFAVSINLNADFEGGDLRFPEFGSRTYRPPAGGAVVFSCSLLHEATPVTRGVRYATLPFLYDEEGERVFEANRHTLVE